MSHKFQHLLLGGFGQTETLIGMQGEFQLRLLQKVKAFAICVRKSYWIFIDFDTQKNIFLFGQILRLIGIIWFPE